jgi:hypothetical protein
MPSHVRYLLIAVEQRGKKVVEWPAIAVELDVLLGNKEVIVANCIVGRKTMEWVSFLAHGTRHTSQGIAPLSFGAFGLDFYSELNTSGSNLHKRIL